jgi:polysaccharide biosynthesis protein PslG
MTATLRKATAALAFALLTACWLLAGEAEHGASARSFTTPLGGVNVTDLGHLSPPAQIDETVAIARRLHAKLLRAEVPWTVMEPRAANVLDPRALAFTDRLVADAARAGIRVIMIVDGTPCWASSAPAPLLAMCTRGEPGRASAWSPSDPATYAAFVGYLAQRYGTQLAAIEIWNEPDQANELYFAGPDKAKRYAALVRAAYPAIKRANPSVPVLAGSLVGSNGVFLRALYAAGIQGYYDGLAVHFYNLTLASLRAIHEVQLANGDMKPLWLDEFGWSSCWPKHRLQEEQACVTARTQGVNLANIFRALARTSYVAAEVVYDLRDSGRDDFGLLTRSGARKPAFATLSRVLASPFGKVDRVSLGLRRRGGRVLAAGSGPVGDYMQLEALKGGVLRYRALFTLDRFDRYSIALPSVLGTHRLRVRVYQYWSGPGSAAQRSI